MALSSNPSLIEINTELGTVGQSLVTCIANAGKTGIWTNQRDFAGYSALDIEIDDTSEIIDYQSQTSLFICNLSSGDAWIVDSKPSWVSSVTPNGGASGTNIAISINVDFNESVERSGDIVFKNTTTLTTVTFSLTQELGMTVTPFLIDAPSAGGTYDIVVTTNDISWNVTDNKTWISTSGASGSGNDTFQVTVNENLGGLRNGIVSVNWDGVSKQISVFQDGV